MKETMTVHKGLCELKLLADRLDKEISNLNMVAINKHSNTKVNGRPLKDVIEEVRDTYKSVNALANRRNAIKYAITNSNAVTKVTIGGKEYTVAQAIDMKSQGLNYKRNILSRLERQFASAQQMAEKENGERLDKRADDYIKSIYQDADMKNLSDDIKKVRDTFIESQTFELVNPLDAAKEIEKLKAEIYAFESDVDSALSVSNAMTSIEVEYEDS